MSDEADPGVLEGLAHTPKTQVNLRKLFLLLTRLHYSDARNFGELHQLMEKYVWKQEEPRTLNILLDFEFTRAQTVAVPTIFVGVTDFTFARKVTDNHKEYTEDRSGRLQVKSTATTAILRHSSGSPDEALILADLTAQFYLGLSDLMKSKLDFSIFEVQQILQPKPLNRTAEQSYQQFDVDVVVGLQFNAVWWTMTESHRIKHVRFQQSLAEFSRGSTVPEK